MDCKIGDIALVVGSIADNLGRLVVVMAPSTRFDGAPGWLVKCVAGRTLGGRRGFDAPIRPCRWVVFADAHLRPIPGLSAEVEESIFSMGRLRFGKPADKTVAGDPSCGVPVRTV